MNCHACATPLSAGARFCHKCGAKTGAASAAGWRAGLPWAIAGVSLGALATILVVRLWGGGGPGESDPRTARAPAAMGGRASDISQLSPEERAIRLFDRVMRYSEAQQLDSMRFFLPMAIQAHRMLPTLSTDARFHLGLLHLAGDDAASALAQADTISTGTPNHLFAFVLRARAYGARRDTTATRRAYAAFLKNETAERARQRPEYAEHGTTLDTFREEARAHSQR